jgi:hypothetical protein
MRIKTTVKFECDKCGKIIEYIPNNRYDFVEENQCWSFKTGRAGYGSKLDGSDVNFDLCDDCLYEFINTFKYKDRIFNSGSNCYYPEEEMKGD